MFDIDSTNTNSLDYYLYYIIALFSFYSIVLMINNSIRKGFPNTTLNISLDVYGKEQHIQIIHDAPTMEQKNLRWNYLVVSSMIKAATWIKAPYIFALYNRVNKFSRAEIGILYALDNLSAMIFGPILGTLSDLYGRRKFCLLYCVIVISHIYLRITGEKILAYPAQILNGITGSILETVFESWLNFEANLLFEKSQEGEMKKNHYLKEIYNKQVYIDCICSIFLTGIATFLYIQFGIFYPFYACMLFSLVAGIMIILLWEENDLKKYSKWISENYEYVYDDYNSEDEKDQIAHTFWEKFNSAWDTIKTKKELLVVGIIESSFKICLELFLFFWTPLLEETADNLIHPGTIYVCFMVARLIGSEVFQCFKIILTTNSYYLTVFVTSTSCLAFFMNYITKEFYVILIMLIYFDGLSGLFQPLMSSIKSELIEEEKRTTIMTFFRIPINFFSILTLILTNVISTKQICLIAFIIMFFASIINLYLIKIHKPSDVKNRRIKKSSALQRH